MRRPVTVVLGGLLLVITTPAFAAAASLAPDRTPSYVRDEIIVRFREAPSATELEAFERRHSLTFHSYAGLGKPRGLGWYLFRIDDGTDAAVVRDLLRSDPMVCYSTLNRLGTWAAVGPPESDEEPPCDPLPSAPPGASPPVASSPAPDRTPSYVRDEILVRFRQAPSATDLEIFTGRQFLTLVAYLGPGAPPGLGWYRFRIDDGMDAAVVRDLLWNDPMVCDATLIPLGPWDAVGPPESDEEPPCDHPAPSALPETPTQNQAAPGGGGGIGAGSGPSEPGLSGEALLLLAVVLVVGLAASLRLRLRLRPKTRP